jgi:hypothetical protein
MPSKNEGNGRQSPLAARTPEPEPDVATFVTALKQRQARGRKSTARPTDKRRLSRRVQITFSSADIPERLRALAEQRELFANNGSPAVSRLVELLLLPQLEAAEQEQGTQDDEETGTGEQWF